MRCLGKQEEWLITEVLPADIMHGSVKGICWRKCHLSFPQTSPAPPHQGIHYIQEALLLVGQRGDGGTPHIDGCHAHQQPQHAAACTRAAAARLAVRTAIAAAMRQAQRRTSQRGCHREQQCQRQQELPRGGVGEGRRGEVHSW